MKSEDMSKAIAKAIAQNKSYVSSAVITFVTYWFLWLPGLIFNIMYLQDARKSERIAGQSLPGTGCLWILLIINVLAVLLFCSLVTVSYLLFYSNFYSN
jgi:hypothetical protein